ncbi:hypothetical protein D0Z07_6170 [Hyphodiscus hymeniophilus]|uniref:FAS1 domain-containing protein n=1 Tax=Hyphodiscus hymeniophilus TaxID=353542 RepID=A0A9P6VF95_9HELO|nr:hypothetical protein D0Z07_6170 [Hyphodiscus hymeniophilus]
MKMLGESLLWLLAISPRPSVQITPLQALQSFPQLSTFQSYIDASPNFTSLLSNANNFTLLAPTNDAFATFTSQNGNLLNSTLLEATLQYSLLNGSFPTLSFTNASQFAATNLNNATYSNVTGGQRIELVLGSDGAPQVLTGNRSISTSTTTDIISAGGIIHIVNEVLTVPVSLVLEVTAAGLEYFISILNLGGYLNTANNYVNEVLDVTDITYFLPNSAAALANATQLFASTSSAQQQAFFEYHIVPGVVAYSSLLTNGSQFKTATGANITVTVQGGDTYINGAKVLSSDYIVANGVAHVIDNLLNVNDTSPPPLPTSSSSSPTPTPTSNPSESPTANTSTSTTAAQASGSKSSLGTGAKAGIGVGAAVGGLLILAALAWCLLRIKKNREDNEEPWGGQNMDEEPRMSKYYVQRGTVQRQQDLGLGLESSGMHGFQHDKVAKGNSHGSSSAPSRPSVPPRSPSRLGSGNEFF